MKRYRLYFANRTFLKAFLLSLVLLGASLYINFHASAFATENESNSVTDVVLSNTRVYDMDALFIYGSIAFWVFLIVLTLRDPKKAPFVFDSIALFVVIRSVFVSLTHIGPFPDQVVLDTPNLIRYFTLGGDLFFSGHTGLPFLMALVFWDSKYLRYFFIGSSILFAFVVLLSHLHYSIDVLSAFFITYTINHLAGRIFKRDKEMFTQGIGI